MLETIMNVATDIWTLDRYHQAVDAGIFSDLNDRAFIIADDSG
jgi:hypothetical protein